MFKSLHRNEIYFFISLFFLISTVVNINIGFALTPTYIFVFLFLLKIFINKRLLFNPERFYFFCFLFLFYFFCIITSFYSFNLDYSFRFSLGAIFLIVTFFTYCFYYINFINEYSFFKNIVFFIKFFIIISVFYVFLGYLDYSSWNEGARSFGVYIEKGIPRAVGFTSDPNFFSFVVIIFFLSSMYYKLSFIFVFSSFLLVFLSLSRSGIVCLILVSFIYIFFNGFKKDLKKLYFILFCIGFFVVLNNFNGIANVISKRVDGAADGGGRFIIWQHGFELFYIKPIFGFGIFTFRDLNFSYFGGKHFAHNTFLEILVETGIFGLSLYLLFILVLYYYCYCSQYVRLLIPVFFTFLFMSFTLSMYLNPIFLFFLIFIFIHLKKKDV